MDVYVMFLALTRSTKQSCLSASCWPPETLKMMRCSFLNADADASTNVNTDS